MNSPAVPVRRVRPSDVPAVVAMVHELAEFERAADQCVLTGAQLHAALFGDVPALFGHVAVEPGTDEPIGFALWFLNYSTWAGVHGIYLEDLYVRPSARGTGAGRALLSALAALCVERGYARLEWWVLHWNRPATSTPPSARGPWTSGFPIASPVTRCGPWPTPADRATIVTGEEATLDTLRTVVLIAATITMGLMAGVFGLYANSIMPALRTTDDQTFVRSFQALDRAILNPLFLAGGFLGTLVLTGLATALHLGAGHRPVLPWVLTAFVLYLATVIITGVVNVPLNNDLKAADPDTADLGAVRARFNETRWSRWNVARAVLCTVALGLLAWALVASGRY